MSQKITVSVVIPAYNEAKHLPKCLQSLREQDYDGEYEIIVVDNGSTDGTGEVARSYGVKVIHCARKGVVYARDAGARASRGDIIVQADADTIMPPDWLSRIVEHFSSHSEDIALSGDVTYINEPLWHKLFHLINRWSKKLSYYFVRYPITILASNFAMKREALLALAGYNLSLPYGGDEDDLLVRLKSLGHVAYDPSLIVKTSSRRFKGRFWQAILLDWFYHSIIALLLYRLAGIRQRGMRQDIRVEERRRPALLVALQIAIPVLLIVILLYSFFVPTATVFGKVYYQEKTRDKVIALTFDDGPNEPYTSQILDILDLYGIKATFFIIGKNVEYYPQVAQNIVARGHVVGNHSWSHRELDVVVDLKEIEIERAQATIENIVGVKPRLYRPPFGRKTPWELEKVHKLGMITVTWSVSARDPAQPPANTIAQRIVRNTKPGAIILLHDGKGTIHGASRSKTVAALPEILETLQAQGYSFVTVPELLKVSPYLP